jgi:mono/diheme cytochrome c family protein
MNDRMPRWVMPGLVVMTVVALVPFALATKTRFSRGPTTRTQIVPDMDQQPRYEAQQGHPRFADGRAMRPPVDGTVARGELSLDAHLHDGKIDGKWAETLPMAATTAMMERGRERYGVFCAACHGQGVGGLEIRGEIQAHGIVDERATVIMEREGGAWTPPTSFHTEEVRGRPVGHLYNTIKNGIRSMPSYASQIPVEDRWAIVLYLRAIQRSQNAKLADVPEDLRGSLR